MICRNIKDIFHASIACDFFCRIRCDQTDFPRKSYMIFLGRVTLSLGEPAPTYETYHGTRQNWNGMRIIKRKDSIALGFCGLVSVLNGDHYLYVHRLVS